jgi:hypothetical protein
LFNGKWPSKHGERGQQDSQGKGTASGYSRNTRHSDAKDMKQALEIHSEGCAAAAAILWFISARVRLKKRSIMRGGLGSGLDDRKTLLLLVYEQSRWSARAAIAAGFAVLLAMLDGLLPKI